MHLKTSCTLSRVVFVYMSSGHVLKLDLKHIGAAKLFEPVAIWGCWVIRDRPLGSKEARPYYLIYINIQAALFLIVDWCLEWCQRALGMCRQVQLTDKLPAKSLCNDFCFLHVKTEQTKTSLSCQSEQWFRIYCSDTIFVHCHRELRSH